MSNLVTENRLEQTRTRVPHTFRALLIVRQVCVCVLCVLGDITICVWSRVVVVVSGLARVSRVGAIIAHKRRGGGDGDECEPQQSSGMTNRTSLG